MRIQKCWKIPRHWEKLLVHHNVGPLESVSTGKDERLVEEQCAVVFYPVGFFLSIARARPTGQVCDHTLFESPPPGISTLLVPGKPPGLQDERKDSILQFLGHQRIRKVAHFKSVRMFIANEWM